MFFHFRDFPYSIMNCEVQVQRMNGIFVVVAVIEMQKKKEKSLTLRCLW